MNISQNGINFIIANEGIRLTAYKCLASEKYWTIGVGHYGADVTPGMVITRAQAEALLRSDLAKFEKNVNKYHAVYNFSQGQYDALVDFAFNLGSIDGLTAKGTRTLKQISDKIPEYCKSGGVTISGLVKRRRAEKEMFDKDLNVVQKASTNTVASFPTLHKGDRGKYVRVMQQALNYHNAHIAGKQIKDDGIYGAITFNTLIEWKALNGLAKSDIVDSTVWQKLMVV